MIGQYLPNNNETATVAFRQKFCQLNSPQIFCDATICWRHLALPKMQHMPVATSTSPERHDACFFFAHLR
jgi:hypothetical protein